MSIADSSHKRFSGWRASEIRPRVLAASLLAGVTIYILEAIVVVSFAALIFSGALAVYLPQALGLILVGNAIVCGGIVLLSSYSGTIGVAQDTSAALMGLAAAAVVAALPALAVAEQFATVVMMIVLTTTLTGLVFLGLGIFKLGGLTRFLPYPVIGGFLAGTGWLLVKGGLGVMVGTPFGWDWAEMPQLSRWLPGVILGIVLFVAVKRIPNALTLPVVLALATVAFYAVALVMNIPIAQLNAEGWLLGTFPAGSLWAFPLNVELVSQVNWAVLIAQLPNLVPVAILSVVALLLNSSGLELVVKRDIDFNRELVAAGVSNLVAGPLGGLVGYSTISFSTLNFSMSGGRRLAGIVTALLVGVTALVGASFLMYVPKMMLGGILVYLGLAFLFEWIYEAWFKFPRIEFAIILSILGVIILRGYLEGVVAGLVLAIILFAINYSRVPVARYALSGAEYSSRSTRSPHARQVLNEHGSELYVLKLQGFLFFGTADKLFEQIRAHTLNPALPLRFVVLDLSLVSGMDSTATLSIKKLLLLLRDKHITPVIAGLKGSLRKQWLEAGMDSEPGLQVFADLDHAVEWCEDRILAEHGQVSVVATSLYDDLTSILPNETGVEKLTRYLERIEIAAGTILIRQGDPPDALYFVESGQLTAQLESDGKGPVRLETVRGQTSIGELGFYLNIPRTASVVADEASVVYRLSRARLQELEKTDADAANALHRIVIYILGHRVRHLTKVVSALER